MYLQRQILRRLLGSKEAEDVFGGVLAQVEFAVRGGLRVASRDRAAITYEKTVLVCSKVSLKLS